MGDFVRFFYVCFDTRRSQFSTEGHRQVGSRLIRGQSWVSRVQYNIHTVLGVIRYVIHYLLFFFFLAPNVHTSIHTYMYYGRLTLYEYKKYYYYNIHFYCCRILFIRPRTNLQTINRKLGSRRETKKGNSRGKCLVLSSLTTSNYSNFPIIIY